MAQKIKTKWGVEGDENTKFFHSMLKRKRRKLSISGLMVDGLWVCNPNQIKDHFLRLYKEKIKSFLGAMLSQPSPRLKRLALVHTESLSS